MIRIIGTIRARANERSTWVSIGGTIVAASALPAPWSYVFVAIGIAGMLCPDGAITLPRNSPGNGP